MEILMHLEMLDSTQKQCLIFLQEEDNEYNFPSVNN